ncbi:ATP-dependent endonuclease [Providencia zhijiangensis]|uniref:ATP-dependent endonuclease n=1 Tax=Providencia zhijiangensis TaxID=3053982 RepID=A0ABZ0N6L2_9GAMM|nr:ATP-dependent endonuclease [Providencia sp. D4759]WPA93426.1 ATP-dependent endonuclease [Providencia sp. D4759]
MRIEKVQVEGFRLLQDVEIMLEDTSTVIVGRNNSGKTSFTEIFERFASDNGAQFRLEDFSPIQRNKFFKAKVLREQDAKAEDILATLPTISLTLTFRYDSTSTNLGPLSPFIIDLDTDSTTAIVCIEYKASPATLHILFDVQPAPDGVEPKSYFLRLLRETLPKAYRTHVSAIDPTDPKNRRSFDGFGNLATLMQCNFVRAQRTLDNEKHGDTDVIGKLLNTLFKTASTPTATTKDQELAGKLRESVEGVERSMQGSFDEMLKSLLPAMEILGFPSLNDTELRPETTLNVEALLTGHTKVVYTGTDGVHLPEGYNGLGTRNLIYMLLQLESYHKLYRARTVCPATHLIFIEEPEAHLHPQMQEVFIAQLNAAIKKLSASYPNEPVWNVQFIISTHSPHVANAASFEAVRYFLNEAPTPQKPRQTKVKDFKKGLGCISPEDQSFLHKYMTLTKCDLYFADKAILVEGTTERLLMPKLCELVDNSLDGKQKLAQQYITNVEVGGAYAHIFYPLLDFLELKTLVITDIDSTQPVEKINKKGNKTINWEKCPVAEGQRTSNAAIKSWFLPDGLSDSDKKKWNITPAELLLKTPVEKLKGSRRIAYQIPEILETGISARSYEDALILANPELFKLTEDQDAAAEAWEIAKTLGKADTALQFAIHKKEWVVPRYIHEGLTWLSEPLSIKENEEQVIPEAV